MLSRDKVSRSSTLTCTEQVTRLSSGCGASPLFRRKVPGGPAIGGNAWGVPRAPLVSPQSPATVYIHALSPPSPLLFFILPHIVSFATLPSSSSLYSPCHLDSTSQYDVAHHREAGLMGGRPSLRPRSHPFGARHLVLQV